jgi:hypothetical protein
MPRRKKTIKSNAPSRKVQQQEIIQCGSDVKYFLHKYVKIPHPKKGLVKFTTFPFQDNCLDAFQDHRYIIVNKSRQLGLSTSAAAYSLWMALFRREKNILVVATKLATAQNFIKKVRTMLKNLPSWLVMPSLVEDNKASLSFSNGSTIKAVPCSEDAGRSEALSLLIVDEAAHIEGIEPMWTAMQPTLSTGGSVILISSPSGVGTLFHRIWVNAQKGENDFHPIELPWTVHPERDEAWFKKESRALIESQGERGVAQELLCSFMSSGDTFLKGDSMDRLFKEIQPPIDKMHHGRFEAWIWKHPEPGHKYIISADVARGDGEDFSAFQILDTNSEEVVVDYQGKPAPDAFAEILLDYAQKYNMALICQELNNVGIACAQKLKESGYPNLYYEKFQKNIYMTYTNQQIGPTDYPGFTTSANSREQILAKLENTIRNNHVKLRSKRLFEELQTFIWKGNKPQAQKGHNDDLVMALAIGCQLFQFSGANQFNNDDAQWALIRGMSRNEQQMNTTTGRTSDGFFSAPGKEKHGEQHVKTQLDREIESTKLKSLSPSNTQDYNSSVWDQVRWIFDD